MPTLGWLGLSGALSEEPRRLPLGAAAQPALRTGTPKGEHGTSKPSPAPTTAKQTAPELNPQATQAKPPASDAKDSITYGGRVLGPDGQPVAGADLYMTRATSYMWRPIPSPKYATTEGDGRFEFTVPKAEFGNLYTVVAALAANHGAGWVQVPNDAKRDDLTIHLVEDDVPITGQIMNLEGKPVANAAIRRAAVNAAPGRGPRSVARSGQSQARIGLGARAKVSRAGHHCTFSQGHDRLQGPLPAHGHRPEPPCQGANRWAEHNQRAAVRPDSPWKAVRSDF